MKNSILLKMVFIFLGVLSSLFCTKKNLQSTDPSPIISPNPSVPIPFPMRIWLTTSDQTQLFKKQNTHFFLNSTANNNITIGVDSTQTFQSLDGFGFALTGGSAKVLNGLNTPQKMDVLTELFGTDSTNIGISYLRISLGASDLSAESFSYDDLPGDSSLSYFSVDKEKADLIPILQMILKINPNIKILASPWSAPAWMKDNQSFTGGSLLPKNYKYYADYFVKYIQAMKLNGISIDAITPQNEPLNPNNNPSMVLPALDEANFIKNYLGPAFSSAALKTKIICYDHNADLISYSSTILNDPGVSPFVDGSAFHLYAGNISSLGFLHNAYPTKNLYFTEQATLYGGNFGGDLAWHIKNLIIGAVRNWSRNVLEWNLAADPNNGPHTQGGCTTCLGALTIGSGITRNVSYYIIAHASKFVRPGAVRIGSDESSGLPNVAFKNVDGSKVLIVLNQATGNQAFNIQYGDKVINTNLPGGAVATYVW